MTALYRSSYRVVYVLTLSVALALIGLGLTSTAPHTVHPSTHMQSMSMSTDMGMEASTSP